MTGTALHAVPSVDTSAVARPLQRTCATRTPNGSEENASSQRHGPGRVVTGRSGPHRRATSSYSCTSMVRLSGEDRATSGSPAACTYVVPARPLRSTRPGASAGAMPVTAQGDAWSARVIVVTWAGESG